MDALFGQDLFQAGLDAYAEGLAPTDCPRMAGSPDHAEWRAGYDEARRQSKLAEPLSSSQDGG